MKRKIPATMVTQHPDHAGKPYWHADEFINTQYETRELYLSFSDLNANEYMWDWEGKFVDEAVVERLFNEYYEYFTENKIGEDKFITFRLPNPEVETEFRIGRAFMGILSASSLARHIGTPKPPLFEVILPMTENATQMLAVQEAFREIATLEHRLFNMKEEKLKHIEIIPLFEEANIIKNSAKIVKEYLNEHIKQFGNKPEYLRVFLARSDPALNAGIVPTVVAIKMALSSFRDLEEELNIKIYPIIGAAGLPFRGGINPDSVKDFTNEYKGVRTITIQSAFRYDYDKEKVKKAIKQIEAILPKQKAQIIEISDQKKFTSIIATFEAIYKDTIVKIAPMINKVASSVPRRRERVQHIGLFGYSRGVGGVKLPRAIGFTAALYSIGVPPELISTGRGLKQIMQNGNIELLEKYYLNFRNDLIKAGYFLNKNVLEKLALADNSWEEIVNDIKYIEDYLGQKLGPKTDYQREHAALTEKIYNKLESGDTDISELIRQAAILRRSLG